MRTSTRLANRILLLNLKRTGAVADIWKRSSFYSASVSAKIRRLRRVEITKDVEGDWWPFFKPIANGEVESDISFLDNLSFS